MNCNKFSIASSCIVILIALLVLCGWQFDIRELKSVTVGYTAMNPLTALAFILLSISLISLQQPAKVNTTAVRIIAALVAVIGLTKVTGTVFNFDFQIDQLLFHRKMFNEHTYQNRMAPNTALNFTLLGYALFNITTNPKKSVLSDYIAIGTGFIGGLSLIGYLYKAPEFYQVKGYLPMSLAAAICFLLASISLITIKKDRGIIDEIIDPHGGKQIATILLPIALILPVLGYLRLQGEKEGYYTTSFGVALFVAVNLTIFISLIWIISKSVNRINLVLLKEIKKREKIEEELRQNNLFLDAILENIPDMVYLKDAKELNFIKINKATEEFLNAERKNIIGKKNFDLLRRNEADYYTELDEKAINSGELIHAPQVKITIGSAEKWINTKRIPIKDSNNTPLYLLCIAEDITERKKEHDKIRNFNRELERKVNERTLELQKSEMRFRSLIENGIDVIVMTDQNGVINYISPSAKKYIGYTDSEIINTWGPSYLHPDDLDQSLKFLAEIRAEPGVPKPHTIRMVHKDGHTIWVEGTIINKLHEESVNALVFNYTDITEKVKTEDEKRLVEQALTEEKLDRQKQILRATLDGQEKERTRIGMELHDNINQILGATQLYLGAARKNPQMLEQMMNKSSKNIMLCIYEIKKLSKALVTPKVHQHGLSHAIIDLIDSVQESTELEFNYNSAEDLLNKMGEKTQLVLYRIIQEQINNIIKHARAKNVFISFEQKDAMVQLIIEDDGKGFDTNGKRWGIGLNNIQNRIEVVNGTVEIISELNQGCKLIVSVPYF
jgi:PAS domain S-box-containing protein